MAAWLEIKQKQNKMAGMMAREEEYCRHLAAWLEIEQKTKTKRKTNRHE